jgi:hypothetical protein
VYNAPPKVTSNWFPERERPYATMVGAGATFLGISIGFMVPTFFVSEFDVTANYTQTELDTFRHQVFTMFLWILVWTSAVTFLVLVFFKSKP